MHRPGVCGLNRWYQWDAAQVVQTLGTHPTKGLDRVDVCRRQHDYGLNELAARPLKSPWVMLWEQLTGATMLLLLAAAVIVAALGDYKDTIAILAIVLFAALLGVSQDYQASQAIVALQSLAVPTVKVCRESQWQEVSAHDLVPGDIISLSAGSLVPADGRLLESVNLRVQESTFTGESEPVEKLVEPLSDANLMLGDRRNMVYMGTVVTYGHGQAVVTETGMQTELGTIAHLIASIEQEPTPLQQRLERLGKKLVVAALAIVGIIFGLGLLRGEAIDVMFLTAVSVAVAIVPEGLPASVTIALAIGSQRMLKRHALIRKLPAVETLGSVSVICSDKTGTLTENCMTVTVLHVTNERIELEAACPLGTDPAAIPLPSAVNLLLAGSALCNDAWLAAPIASDGVRSLGDPTEIALLVAAARLGLLKTDLEQRLPRVAEVPFDSHRKRMTTLHRLPSDTERLADLSVANWGLGADSASASAYVAFTKGEVTSVLQASSQILANNQVEPLQAEWRDRIFALNDQLAAAGTRVLGVSYRWLSVLPAPSDMACVEQDLIFIGLVGMLDPARPEVKQAVATCKAAGIRPVMVTGDHPLMGQTIAQDLGIAIEGQVLTGADLEQLSPEAFRQRIETVSVYARVSPEQKLKIVQAFQQQGHIVAMTGDGVNDAPALKKADIGVAMGQMGTDVAKEAADMVLLDDNFATIVTAVGEGRVIYDNIRKFIKYSLTGNAGGVWIMLLAPLLAMPLPLLPIQILWINLLADGLLALALSVEPAERNIMQRPPQRLDENIFGRGMGRDIVWVGWLIGFVILAIGYLYWSHDRSSWQTLIFSMLTFARVGLALAFRSDHDLLVQIGVFSNQPLLLAAAGTLLAQLAVIYTPALQTVFQTSALSLPDLMVCLVSSTIAFWAVELQKLIHQSRTVS